MPIKKIQSHVWSFWDLDISKMVKAYNDDLKFVGYLYYGGSRLILLSIEGA